MPVVFHRSGSNDLNAGAGREIRKEDLRGRGKDRFLLLSFPLCFFSSPLFRFPLSLL